MIGYLGAAGAAMQGLGSLVSAFGKKSKGTDPEELAYQQYLYQKEFAQNGIQWKVQDAQKAGLHPLAALGASSASYTPVAVTGGGDSSSSGKLSNALQGMGQAVSGVAGALSKREAQQMAEEERFMKYSTWQAQLANTQAETKMREANTNLILEKMKQLGMPRQPGMPMINGNPYELEGQNITNLNGVAPGSSYPVAQGTMFITMPDGKLKMVPTPALTQSYENQEIFGTNYGRLFDDIKYHLMPSVQRFTRKYVPIDKPVGHYLKRFADFWLN